MSASEHAVATLRLTHEFTRPLVHVASLQSMATLKLERNACAGGS